MRVSSHVSPVSTLLPVRGFLVDQQRAMAEAGGVILDGRDIGTHVFPDAELKIFMTASFEIRTKRRYDELTLKLSNVSLEEIEENLSTRDRIDSTRAHSPLRMADDARELDNSDLSISDQLDLAMSWIEEIILLDSE
jgi:cytidylate kinase